MAIPFTRDATTDNTRRTPLHPGRRILRRIWSEPRLDLRQGASWAVWGETTGDLSVFDDANKILPRLRKDVVLIGANFDLGKDGGGFKPFQNSHSRVAAVIRSCATGSA